MADKYHVAPTLNEIVFIALTVLIATGIWAAIHYSMMVYYGS